MDAFEFSSTLNSEDGESEKMEWWISALIFGSFTGICGYVIIFYSIFHNYLAIRLKNYGENMSAIIVSKREDDTDDGATYIVKYKYTIDDIEYQCSSTVAPSDYTRLSINQQIDIICDPIHPKNADLAKDYDENFMCGVVASLLFSHVFGIGIIIGCAFGSKLTVHPHQISLGIGATLSFGIIIAIPFCIFKCYKKGIISCSYKTKKRKESMQNEVDLAENVSDNKS